MRKYYGFYLQVCKLRTKSLARAARRILREEDIETIQDNSRVFQILKPRSSEGSRSGQRSKPVYFDVAGSKNRTLPNSDSKLRQSTLLGFVTM